MDVKERMVVKVDRVGSNLTVTFPYDPYLKNKFAEVVMARKWHSPSKSWLVPLSCAHDVSKFCKEILEKAGTPVPYSQDRTFPDYEVEGEGFASDASYRGDILAKGPRAKALDDLHPEIRAKLAGTEVETLLDPYEHQTAGLAWLLFAESGLLLDEMGLGKTKQIIDYGTILMNQGIVDRVVIVCPATLKRNWAKEIRMNNGARAMAGVVTIVAGSKRIRRRLEKRILQENSPVKWVIYNYEQTWRSERFFEIAHGSLLVADEAHKLKNEGARQTKAFAAVAKGAFFCEGEGDGLKLPTNEEEAAEALTKLKSERVVLLTGSPVVNKAEDLYNLSELVSPGLLGSSRWAFLQKYARLGNNGWGTQVEGYKNLDDVTARVSRISLRRLKSDCTDLDPKIYMTQELEIEGEQDQAYLEIVRDLQTAIQDSEGEEIFVQIKNAMTQLIRLQQCVDGFISNGPEHKFFKNGGIKFKALDELIEEIGDAEKKLVIWTRFVAPIQFMLDRYAKSNPVAIYGGVNQSQREVNVETFQEDPNCKLFIGQVHTAGLGLTLTAASDQVFLSRWWSPSVNQQAEDRLHRIGQENTVTVSSLVTVAGSKTKKGLFDEAIQTIDEIVAATLKDKAHLAGELTGDNGVLQMKEILRIAGME